MRWLPSSTPIPPRISGSVCGKPAEAADDAAQFALAAVAREHAEEVARDRVEPELRGERGERVAGLFAADQRTRDQLGEIPGIEQRLVQRIQAAVDGIDLPLIARKTEQSGRVAPC